VTPAEFKAAREQLGLTQVEFARVFKVDLRTVGGWEQGVRNRKSTAIPPVIALFVQAALRHPVVRRELGISS
jgi:transcriptional regulator with XRE-family HTH domain